MSLFILLIVFGVLWFFAMLAFGPKDIRGEEAIGIIIGAIFLLFLSWMLIRGVQYHLQLIGF